MAYAIRIKNKDFSAIRSAIVRGTTSVLSGLLAYYETRGDAATALTNGATGVLDGTASGIPTFTAAHAVVDKDNALLFGTKPAASASRTLALILRPISASVTTYPLGSFGASPTTNGAEYLRLAGLAVNYEGTTFNPSTRASTGNANTPGITLELNTYDLLLVRITDQQKVDLIRPRTSETKTVATTNTLAFLEAAPNYRAAISTSTTDDNNIALFAHWNRALTDQEIAKFYAEQKAKFSAFMTL